ncbi:hypothetical protein CC2G_013017 [Coprinopsis cinerea AmutBmut pab1-1]|nr:hypothetical protein CC2G_013017 [Coprinopsis cinerea AmutBmut pab1-1]
MADVIDDQDDQDLPQWMPDPEMGQNTDRQVGESPVPASEPAVDENPTGLRRSARVRRPAPLQTAVPPPESPVQSPSPPPTPAQALPKLERTAPNKFGVFRVYMGGSPDPPPKEPKSTRSLFERFKDNIYAPFPNATSFHLVDWFYSTGRTLSSLKFADLVNIMKGQEFDLNDVANMNPKEELERLDSDDHEASPFASLSSWKTSSVEIPMPCERCRWPSEADAPQLKIDGVQHRSLTQLIVDAFSNPRSAGFQFTPYKEFWKADPSAPPEQLIGEVYTSSAFLEEHQAILQAPRIEGDSDDIPYAIASILLWSDSTHLTSFGDASLWPIYAYFGNQSKYERCKPSKFAAHHLAYIPTIPKDFQDEYREQYGVAAATQTVTLLRRQLFHAVWKLLLDPEFMEAYKKGILVHCADGILRRLFPRFFFYSADYPEKVLVATIQYLAHSGCPGCYTAKEFFDELGTQDDDIRRDEIREDNKEYRKRIRDAREQIFEKGAGVDWKAVKDILSDRSEVPVENAFSARLSPFGFNFFSMFVPDILHDFELGVWKAVFAHLMRILHAISGDFVQELNERYRAIPPFGRNTIRRFAQNASAMKKLAGRDYEDLLQCAFPVFEDLLISSASGDQQWAPLQRSINHLIFVLCCWHALSKLRLHTTSTMKNVKRVTRALGFSARRFRRLSSRVKTKELPGEYAARNRRRARAAASGASTSDTTQNTTPRKKRLNFQTPKFHFLGHLVRAIATFGTSDNYTTQVGEQEHRRVKQFYVITNKREGYEAQIACHYRRQHLLAVIKAREQEAKMLELEVFRELEERKILGPGPTIRGSEKNFKFLADTSEPINVFSWVARHSEDPALKTFYSDLTKHLLARIRFPDSPREQEDALDTFTADDMACISILDRTIYRHRTIRFQYTTYDMQEEWDYVSPRSNTCNVMTLAYDRPEDRPHPYWYARVCGIYHATVLYRPNARAPFQKYAMPFLWVRFYGRDLEEDSPGLEGGQYQRVGFLDAHNEENHAFGFIDPAQVIRACHVIPGFRFGKTSDLLGKSVSRRAGEDEEDYRFYYVNPVADRDMFMRFTGGGPGHGQPLPYYPLKLELLYPDRAFGDDGSSTTEEEQREEYDQDDEEVDFGYQTDQDDGDLPPEGGPPPEDEEEDEFTALGFGEP